MKDLTVCVDKKIVSLRKIELSGWACATKGEKIVVTTNNRHTKITYTDRKDIKQMFNSQAVIGYKIETTSLGRLNLCFMSGNTIEKISYFCMKLRIKYFGEVLKKVKQKISEHGVLTAFKIILCRLRGIPFHVQSSENYEEWYKFHKATEESLVLQRKKVFEYQPLISIVIPTYNTPLKYLKEVIYSVENQSYTNWELILVDGHSTNKDTVGLLRNIDNPKVKVIFLSENKMISGNTNEGISHAKGNFIGLVDHDDLLTPDALYEMVRKLNESDYDMVYSDEDKTDSNTTHFYQPHFKPDFSIDTLRSYNYITHFTIIRQSILNKAGYFDSECDGAQDYDMVLRVTDITKKIGHVQKILYHWRVHDNSTSQSVDTKTYVLEAGKKALRKHLQRNNINGEVVDGMFPTSYRISYEIKGYPLVSIMIPNKDHIVDLKRCLDSIRRNTTYENYEVIVIENNSKEEKTFDYYKEIEKDQRVQIVCWDNDFNYSAINNYGTTFAKGEYLLLLNNDIEILNSTWLNEMLMLAQRSDVGFVGAKLYYPNDTIQHAGVIVGIGGVAGHSHKYFPANSDGYMGRLKIVQNVSAVTAACLLVKKSKYDEVEGLDEGYKVAFNDVDFCMKLIEKGYVGVFTPYAEMIHYESLSRGAEDSPEKIERFNREIKRFENKWGLWREDSCYNSNLSNTHENFSLRNNSSL